MPDSRLAKAGITQAEIDKALEVSQGTVRAGNSPGTRGYRFQPAQRTAQSRHAQVRHKPRKLPLRVRRAIARKLRAERWSPEQIRFWLRDAGGVSLRHEWIYRMIGDDTRAGGDLWRFLRRRGKRYNRRGAQRTRRGGIPPRVDIAERPAIVNSKSWLGDGDPIVGTQHNGALRTHVERKSLFTTISKLVRPTAKAAHRATVHRLIPLRDYVHTITDDTGKEFAGHRKTAHRLHAQVFFATPYHAWERGLNEHTTGLIRDVFPTDTDFTTIHPATVATVERLLNRRPRKSLGFKTPNAVFHALARSG